MAKMLDDWKQAKKDFETLTGKKKPTEKVLGLFRKSTGLEDALKACDTALDKKDAPKLEKATAELKKVATTYGSQLADAITKEKMENDVKTELQKGLKVLKTRLDKFVTHFEAAVEADKQFAKGGKPDIKAGLAATAPKLVMKALADCTAAVAKLKALPTSETYNKEVHTAARSLTTALRNFEMADKNATHAKPFITKLAPWADGGKGKDLTKMVNGAKEAEVIEAGKQFSAVIKEVAAKYPKGSPA